MRRKTGKSRQKPTQDIVPPTLSDTRSTRADWVEWATLSSPDRNVSAVELRSLLDREDSIDALSDQREPDGDVLDAVLSQEGAVEESVQCEAAANETFDEIYARSVACGTGYPFDVQIESIQRRDDTQASVYVFMLLLSLLGAKTTDEHEDGTKLFEEVSAAALREYLRWRDGDEALVQTRVFGFPRRQTKDSFAAALDALCSKLGEGGGHKNRPDTNDQKDAALDVAVWRCFPDGRVGKHILFGQCATGRNWQGKLLELPDTDRWCRYYMNEGPAVLPLRVFLVPHAVDDKHWGKACYFGDLVFDRCRIAYCCRTLDTDLSTRVAEWNKRILQELSAA